MFGGGVAQQQGDKSSHFDITQQTQQHCIKTVKNILFEAIGPERKLCGVVFSIFGRHD